MDVEGRRHHRIRQLGSTERLTAHRPAIRRAWGFESPASSDGEERDRLRTVLETHITQPRAAAHIV
jgi:hypothetical protein